MSPPAATPASGPTATFLTGAPVNPLSSDRSSSPCQIPLSASARLVGRSLLRDQMLPELWDLLQHSSTSRDYLSLSDSQSLSPSTRSKDANAYSLLELRRIVLIPDLILSQYDRVECKCFMGLLPSINRAWMTVDNKLFLWDFESGRDLTCFDQLNDVIIDVALVPPLPGVFVPSIRHVLLVITPLEIHILGISFSSSPLLPPASATTATISATFLGNSGKDGMDQSSMLESYSISGDLVLHKTGLSFPSDDVAMLSVIGTIDGRIFTAGHDGMLYELAYQANDSWFSKKCRKICRTGSIFSLLIPPFLMRSSTQNCSLFSLAYDMHRNLIYGLTEDGKLHAFWLGIDGQSFTHLSTIASISDQAARLAPTGVGKSLQLVSIHIVPPEDSAFIHLLAVASNGIRLYFTTLSRDKRAYDRAFLLSTPFTPSTLELVHVRLPVEESRFRDPRRLITRWAPQVHVSFYKDGLSVAASSIGDQEDLLCIHMFNPAIAVSSNRNLAMEMALQLPIEGKAWDMCTWKSPSQSLYPNSSTITNNGNIESAEGLASHPPSPLLDLCNPYRRSTDLLILTNAGIYVYERQKPIDRLQTLLLNSEGSVDAPSLQSFFDTLTPEQACALCIQLACTLQKSEQSKHLFPSATDPQSLLSLWATSTLLRFGGLPRMLNSHDSPLPTTPTLILPEHSIHDIYATSRAEIQDSPLHNGFYLYASRLLAPVWKRPLHSFGTIPLSVVMELQSLDDFFTRNASVLFSRKPPTTISASIASQSTQDNKNLLMLQRESDSLRNLHQIIKLSIELLAFISLCQDYSIFESFGPASTSLPDDSLDFESLLATERGQSTIKELGTRLVHRQLQLQTSVEPLCDILRKRCPAYFGEDEILFYEGTEALERASRVKLEEDRVYYLEESLNYFLRSIGSIPRERLAEICAKFQKLAFYGGIVELSLQAASHCDPDNIALVAYRSPDLQLDQKQAGRVQNREAIYEAIFKALATLTGESLTISTSDSIMYNIDNLRIMTISKAISSSDELFHYRLYGWLLDRGLVSILLDINTPFIETFLLRAFDSGSATHAEVLWKFYSRHRRYLDAAQILFSLATSANFPLDLNGRIERLSLAVTNARSSLAEAVSSIEPDAIDFARELEERLEVAYVQLEVLRQAVRELGIDAEDSIEVRQLNSELYTISDLFNLFARPLKLPEACLLIMHCASYSDTSLVGLFWQQIVDKCLKSTGGDNRFVYLGQKIEEFVKKLYPSETAFPLGYIVDLLIMVAYKENQPASWLISTLGRDIPAADLFKVLHALTEQPTWSENAGPRAYLYSVIAEYLESWIEKPPAPMDVKYLSTKIYDKIGTYILTLTSSNLPSILSRYQILQQAIHQRYRSKSNRL